MRLKQIIAGATADIISSSSTVTGQLSSNSDYDYFAIDVASAGFINLDFDSPHR